MHTQQKYVLAAGAAALVAALALGFAGCKRTAKGDVTFRLSDAPPTVEFTYQPTTPRDVAEVQGRLVIKDDYGIDFDSYVLEIPEANKKLNYGIADVVGRELDQPLRFDFIANAPEVRVQRQFTVRVTVKDDLGQEGKTEVVVKLQ
jgi:hypothetical protein